MGKPAMDLEELAQLVMRTDARQQLGELISRYGMAVDDRDFAALGALFAPDGEFNGVKGRQTIVDFYRARTATFTISTHYAHGWHFNFESDTRASGVVNAHAELCIAGKTIRISLRYLDQYVKDAQTWMFQSRKLQFRYVLPLDEVADGLDQAVRVRWPGTQPQAADLPDKLQTYIDSLGARVPGALPPNAQPAASQALHFRPADGVGPA